MTEFVKLLHYCLNCCSPRHCNIPVNIPVGTPAAEGLGRLGKRNVKCNR